MTQITTTDDLAALFPPELSTEKRFPMPIQIFVRRDGTVHTIHSGFISPAAAKEHEQLKTALEGIIKEIVAEPKK